MKTPTILLLLVIGSNANLLKSPSLEGEPNDPAVLKTRPELEPTPPQSNPIYSENCGTSPKSCPKSPYRSVDGSCNNLKHTDWGTPNMPYGRLWPPNKRCNVSTSGDPLPNARLLSLLLYPHKEVEDPKLTILAMILGQLLAHDMSFTAGISPTVTPLFTCCLNGQYTNESQSNPRCAPITIPPNDPSHPNDQCMEFVKTLSTRHAQPITAVNPLIDLSVIYGQNETHAKYLRSGCSGNLATVMRNGQEWPLQTPNSQSVCFVDSPNETCYDSGDGRINQNPQLALLHVLFIRTHNKIADKMHKYNSHWNDEILYQETRRLIIAMFQRMIYYEYLPKILGHENVVKAKLIYPGPVRQVNDYDSKVNPHVTVEHASAEFRYFHTNIASLIKMSLACGQDDGSLRLSDFFTKPSVLDNNFQEVARGMNRQHQGAADKYLSKEITEFLFRGSEKFGLDLRALDIERAREHCLPSYNDLREYCGLPRAKEFADFSDVLSNETIKKLRHSYQHTDDVDLMVAGSLEQHVNGSLLGPTFLCIACKQFHRTRVGDRFFFENANTDTAFTHSQLQSIHEGGTLAGLFCYVLGKKFSIQPRALELVSDTNRLTPCDQIPFVNLYLWKDNKKT